MKNLLLLPLLALGIHAFAAEAGPTLQDLDQRLKAAEDKLAAQAAAPAADATASAGTGGFSFQSADKKYSIKFSGLLQTDARTFSGDDLKPGTNEILIRRARFQLD